MFIIIILIVTIFFCHGLVRLCLSIMRPRPREANDVTARHRMPFIAPGGYAIPREPIRVRLARDEEAAGIERTTSKTLPPAYGLWRESVVCIRKSHRGTNGDSATC